MSIPDPGSLRPRVVTLGTAGGPRWWRGEQASRRTGIATAVVVGEAVYLVDCGHGVGRRMSEAGLEIRDLRGIFLTHLHSDHTVDLASLAIFGLYELLDRVGLAVVLASGAVGSALGRGCRSSARSAATPSTACRKPSAPTARSASSTAPSAGTTSRRTRSRPRRPSDGAAPAGRLARQRRHEVLDLVAPGEHQQRLP
mgnify:CR=1 FL=1